MSELTDNEKNHLAREFYHEFLLPIADRRSAVQHEIFPLAPDLQAETYFRDRHDTGSYLHEIDSNNFADELREMWKSTPELEACAAELAILANRLRDDNDEIESDVSPFIYAMF